MALVGSIGPDTPVTETPQDVYGGGVALTTQPLINHLLQEGKVFETTTPPLELPSSGTLRTLIVTGADPIILLRRELQYDGPSGILVSIYEDPTYTGGTPVPYWNTAPNVGTPGLVQLLQGATITDPGTLALAPRGFLGYASAGGRQVVLTADEFTNAPINLAANTTYLLEVVNRSAADTCNYSSYYLWYEGPFYEPL